MKSIKYELFSHLGIHGVREGQSVIAICNDEFMAAKIVSLLNIKDLQGKLDKLADFENLAASVDDNQGQLSVQGMGDVVLRTHINPDVNSLRDLLERVQERQVVSDCVLVSKAG